MIATIALIIITIWLAIVIFLCRRIPVWLGAEKYKTAVGFMMFPLVFLAPALQDFVGLWQFKKLCDANDSIYVSSDWRNVKRAVGGSIEPVELSGNWISIKEWTVTYLNPDNNTVFFSYRGYSTDFGWLGEIISFGNSKVCDPVNLNMIQQQIKLDELIKEGKKS